MTEVLPETVLVTNVPESERAFAEAHLVGSHLLEAPLSPGLAEAHPSTRVLACMIHDPVEVETLAALEDLEAVITRSDGFDHLPLAWLEEAGLPAYHLHDYAVPAVTEFTLGMIIALLRRVPEARAITQGARPRWDRSELIGRGLPDVTVGVLGTGRIGSQVARRLVDLGADVAGHDIDPDPALAELKGFDYTGSLEALLETSDVLTLHVPLDESTRGLIDAQALARMPERALLVNTARGPVVDQAAVEQALEAGRLSGYAADVMPEEPEVPALARFQGRDDTILTPHLAAYDARTTDERYARTARIARAVLDGQEEAVERYRII